MNTDIETILELLPRAYKPFPRTEYPMPVAQAILGEEPCIERLRGWLIESARGELKDMLEPVAIAAEIIESNAGDRNEFYMDDEQVRSYVFSGAKWRAGWVLVAGDAINASLIEQLQDNEYMVFSSQHDLTCDHALPTRETGAVHFLQLMVRYAMIWGRIAPGEDHEMAHFLERDMPGAIVVMGSVGSIEGLVLLALMKMGCPAVVDSAFPYDIGPRAVAQSEDEVLRALAQFPNMRVRVIAGEEFTLPDGADLAYLHEQVEPARQIKGILQLRPADCEPGVVMAGNESCDHVAIIVEIADQKLDLPVSAHLETQAISYGSYLCGVKTRRNDSGDFVIELAEGVELDGCLLGEVIRSGLKRAFPRLGSIKVHLNFSEDAVRREMATAAEFNRTRDQAILRESEESVGEFHACIDCQPFSHSHVCIVTPARPPMCGKSRGQIKAAALWGTDYRPWTRRDKANDDLQYVIEKGEPIDAAAGEWTGVNEAVAQLTGGTLERVRLHSVAIAPHSSCGCFGALAFQIPETNWIGVMERGYEGTAPGGLNWSILANQAGGKQSPGVTGISMSYLTSPKAFAGEGGLAAVKWATKRAHQLMVPNLPEGAKVATEDDAMTIEELRYFLSSQQ